MQAMEHQVYSRRDWLRRAGVAALAGRRSKPNILFLLSDDQRFDTLGAMRHPQVRTPNLDKLAGRGIAFTHACIMGGTMGAVCVPSRGMLLTGQTLFHVHDRLIQNNGENSGRGPFVMFPEAFRRAGYVTYGIGKWHNGPSLYARCFTGGDNVFFGGMSDHRQVPVADFDPTGQYPQEKRRLGGTFSSELFADSAVRFLREYRDDKPFLLYTAFTAPHDPRTAPPEYSALYPPERIQLPPNFLPEHPFDNGEMRVRDEALAPWPRTPQVVREHLAAYYAMITHLDAQIGRVLQALRETGREKDTIVVFAGDNGLAVGQHGLLGKQNLYDHSVRVPLILAGPGLPANRRADTLCYLLDVFPTLCDLTGAPAPQTIEGRSLLPAIGNPKTRVRDSVFLAYRHFQRGVRTDRWKLLRYNVRGKQTTQLFDLASDPWEKNNRAVAEPARVQEMSALLQRWMREVDDPLRLDQPDWGYVAAR